MNLVLLENFRTLLGLNMDKYPYVNYVTPSELDNYAYCPRKPFIRYYYVNIQEQIIDKSVEMLVGTDIHDEVYAGVPITKEDIVSSLVYDGYTGRIYNLGISCIYPTKFGDILLYGKPDSVSVSHVSTKTGNELLLFSLEELKTKEGTIISKIHSISNIPYSSYLQASAYAFIIESYPFFKVRNFVIMIADRDTGEIVKSLIGNPMKRDKVSSALDSFISDMYSGKAPSGPKYPDRCDKCILKDKCKTLTDSDVASIVEEVKLHREANCAF